MFSRKICSENVIEEFKNKGYVFNHIAEMNIITITDKKKLYDFYNKHNMHIVKCKLNAMINKNKSLINKFDRSWRHPRNRRFENY